MYRTPSNYAEWMDILDIFEEGQDDINALKALQKGSLVWQAGLADRFTQRLCDVFKARMDRAQDKFSHTCRNSTSESGIVAAILPLRKELQMMLKFMTLPALPEEHRNQYKQIVQDQADKIQESLEISAKKDRTGRLLALMRRNAVNKL